MVSKKLHMQTGLPEKSPVKTLADLNLCDDFLFDVATIDLETCKDMIEIILDMKIKSIHWKEGQKVVHNLPGKRGIRMDFYVEDMDGNIFNVEMQKKDEGNLPKRTRFYQALLDAPMLDRGERGFDNMNPTYIIVICCFDPFNRNSYRYTFQNRSLEYDDLLLGDEATKIFLNTRGTNNTQIPKVLVDFLHYIEHSSENSLSNDVDPRLLRLHQKICSIKNDQKMEVAYMKTEERERLLREEGMAIGAQNELSKAVSALSAKNYSPKEIADLLDKDLSVILNILNN